MNDDDHSAECHSRPWRQIRVRSGIVIKDAVGATVLLLPYTGRSSEERKARTAALILAAINDGGNLDGDRREPARAAFGAPEAFRPGGSLLETLTLGLGPPRAERERVDPDGVEG